ncbi:hypothetical protein OUY22_17095 [Nonomuraea sp. MCN248]|uniref:CU044_5270 family protein n=1 Tax=Nonomuraea corallina TaxID=2989783 RepID=A0ABT4SD50_9ACTN|nr:hypothetical protein [Nonomuraea corallina]MDA0635137.1 hypothetical protein [Nonomuraea corallina]
MDDLRQLRDLYGEPRPGPGAQARVWRRVWGGRRRRLAWPVALAVAATAFLLFGMVLTRSTTHDVPAPDGRSVLLAAATTASVTGQDGAYWHIRKLHDDTRTTELWATRDGRAWKSERARQGVDAPVRAVTDGSPFSIAGRDVTFEQIQNLPADPAALRTWMASMAPADLLADALAGLLWSKPSPPAVRAAAYRALADLPEVRYLGGRTDTEGRDGEAFSFALADGGRRTLIIDPGTSQVLAAVDDDGRSEVVLDVGWTDRAPGRT